jgi:hypothetical protein
MFIPILFRMLFILYLYGTKKLKKGFNYKQNGPNDIISDLELMIPHADMPLLESLSISVYNNRKAYSIDDFFEILTLLSDRAVELASGKKK